MATMILDNEGLCTRCAGGAIPGLDFCVNCANDALVDGVWVGPEDPRHPWAILSAHAKAQREADAQFAARMQGQPYPYEEFDDDAFYLAESEWKAMEDGRHTLGAY